MNASVVTVLVTGTPGTGKTTLAKKLSLLLDYAYFDVNSFAKAAHIYSSYDRKRRTYVLDEAKLARSLMKVRAEALENAFRAPKTAKMGIIFDSHLSHYFPRKYADLCIVTSCSLKTLEHRLKKKGYGKAKVRENLDAEIFDTCLAEAREMDHKILKFDTTKATAADVKALAHRIRRQVRT
ncbi:AAA family ATPase [Candidatus Woesearchaeota archaeon]|nr:AAA family ATPase [Candidatus Woesearchaeota archaeon]